MVEKLLQAKTAQGTIELAKLAQDMHSFGKRLEDYTDSKCIYSR